MSARLRTHHAVLIGIGCAVAAITACSSPEPTSSDEAAGAEPASPKVTQASSVAVEIFDVKGASVGTCSGTLLSEKLVLTAGHCIAGATKWKITSAVGQSEATVAATPWKNFGSDLSHPEHSDVGLILLSSPIKLDAYPQLATAKASEGATATRFHRDSATATSATSSQVTLKLGDAQGFRLAYLVEAPFGEFLDAGGAVVDESGKIVGIVSGRGKQSGLLHVARVDGFANWSKSAVSCSTGLGVRSWGGGNGTTPPSKPGGGGWGGGTSSGGWGSSSGGYGGSGGVGSSSGATMDGGATVPGSSSGSSGSSGTNTGSSSGDSTGGSSGGSSGSSGSSGGSATPGNGDGDTCPGVPKCEGDGCGAGSNGNNGGTGSGGGNGSGDTNTGNNGGSGNGAGDNNGGTGSGGGNNGGTGSGGGDGEPCTGANDNPDTCPPAPDGADCNGPTCGGTSTPGGDDNMDYGACPACGDGEPIVR